jgi:hypothetical protein
LRKQAGPQVAIHMRYLLSKANMYLFDIVTLTCWFLKYTCSHWNHNYSVRIGWVSTTYRVFHTMAIEYNLETVKNFVLFFFPTNCSHIFTTI